MKTALCVVLASLSTLAVAEDKWSPRLHLEYQGGEQRTLGRASVTYPLYQDDDEMVFTDFRYFEDDNNNREGNLGLAWRRIFDERYITGVYAFADRRRSNFGNTFNQLTLGSEFLTDNFEFRANLYIPENEQKATGSITLPRFVNSGGNLFISEQTLTAFEKPLGGYDAEIGYGFHLGRSNRLWLHGGYFRFEEDNFREVDGPSARVRYEWHNPFDFKGARIDFGAEYRDDDVRGTNKLVSLSISIPFGKKSRTTEAYSSLSALDVRMMTPIMRDIDIVSDSQDLSRLPGTPFGPQITNTRLVETAFSIKSLDASEPAILRSTFQNVIEVFGVKLYFTSGVANSAALHAANVLAQYLDNDGDGLADTQEVVQALLARNRGLMMFANAAEKDRLLDPLLGTPNQVHFNALQDLQADEVRQNGVGNQFDGSLEEVLHLITDTGYANWRPSVFGENANSTLGRLHDASIRNGNYIQQPDVVGLPDSYSEYIYWAITSRLGGQNFPTRLSQIQGEWKLNTAEKIRTAEPALHNFLTDPNNRLPTVLPDANYQVR